ncbi:hypothetical protein K7X08_025235 [Anisodus acutangulus]|uniref:Uncharacterized protein n=1 Tax=Anisodus acutangulus TaxID=402998 RepID=A0A9Q1RG26_9SOLA|nr:hypothetical protein K7X08_025235 [Anisodus acutangulus]
MKRSSQSDKGGDDSIGYIEWASPTVGGYTCPGVGTRDVGECRQEANLKYFQEIFTEQVTPLGNFLNGPVVSTGQVNEHTNVASRHLIGNIISYKRKKKLRVASPPHSEVHAQNEQGSSPKTFGESGVANAIIEDVYLLSYSPKMTLSRDMDHGVFAVGDRTSENVNPLLLGPLQTPTLPSQQADAEVSSEQGESLIGDKMREEHDLFMPDPLQTPSFPYEQGEYVVEEQRTSVLDSVALDSIEATTNVPATEQVSLEIQTSIRDGGRE